MGPKAGEPAAAPRQTADVRIDREAIVLNSYGTVSHDGKHWKIQCEPHIRARIKRVFPRAPTMAKEYIRISDSPENSRELEWRSEEHTSELQSLMRNSYAVLCLK